MNQRLVRDDRQTGFECHVVLLLFVSLLGCGSEEGIPKSAELIVTARQAVEQGDTEVALAALSESIDLEPTAWAYALRARLHAKAGKDAEAQSDCDEGLKLDPGNAELQWVVKQLKRPVAKRFESATLPTSK